MDTTAPASAPKPHHMAKYRTCKSAFDFAADLEKAAQVLGVQSVREATVLLALALHKRITELTPVANPDLWKHKRPHTGGRARANWFIAEGAPRRDTTKSTTPKAQPALTGKTVIFITNSLPYIVPLEYGHSGQAPGGMVRIALIEVMARLIVGKASA